MFKSAFVFLSTIPLLYACAPATNITRNIPLVGSEVSCSLPSERQIWFTPLMCGQSSHPWRKDYGAVDYLNLFEEDAPWGNASRRVQIFKFYVSTLNTLSNTQLCKIINYLKRHKIDIALEVPALTWTSECGRGIEGFSYNAQQQTLRLAQRIEQAGGRLNFIAMDEPLTFGTASPSMGCGMAVEQVAREVYDYITAMKSILPEVVIGDIEYVGGDVEKIKQFLEAYRDISGEYLPFLHGDIEWRHRYKWPERTKELEDYCRQRRIKFGVIYNGNDDASSDAEWIKQAEEHMAKYESMGGHPDHIVFQSWHRHPEHLLPEEDTTSFTYLINRYFDIRTRLFLTFERSSSSRTVVGKLRDISDRPIIGASIELQVKPRGGKAERAKYAIKGVVPNNAQEAVVGFRVNTEGIDGNGYLEFCLYEVNYSEENEDRQRVPNGNFAQGLKGWGFLTSNTVYLQEKNAFAEPVLKVRATSKERATINSARFPVTARAAYNLTFTAEVNPMSQEDVGYFTIIFLSGSSELVRKNIFIEPPSEVINVITNENGEFRLDLNEKQRFPLIIQGKFIGNSTYWPACDKINIP